ncbi:hypothetical protein [Bacillus sp. FJAT-49736]|uniref:hypothetical protein n=1 Tax=Bacillus sp. FJAT-49736 TaxID=2833582 RepID=UPI001BC996B9|nr:hypothetical protein [Bacillus sp. FJAT-49736]MBS4173506.1 hypothetical protein [Bacillus sp. FJAT-49736]
MTEQEERFENIKALWKYKDENPSADILAQITHQDIGWLIETVEQLEAENGSMAEKHAEKDTIIAQLLTRIQELEIIKKAYEALKKAL